MSEPTKEAWRDDLDARFNVVHGRINALLKRIESLEGAASLSPGGAASEASALDSGLKDESRGEGRPGDRGGSQPAPVCWKCGAIWDDCPDCAYTPPTGEAGASAAMLRSILRGGPFIYGECRDAIRDGADALEREAWRASTQRTHDEGCWRQHLECAVAEVERLGGKVDKLGKMNLRLGERNRELRAEVERLQGQVKHWRDARQAALDGGDALKAEVERLRGECERLSRPLDVEAAERAYLEGLRFVDRYECEQNGYHKGFVARILAAAKGGAK